MNSLARILTIVSDLRFFYILFIPVIIENYFVPDFQSNFFEALLKLFISVILILIVCLLIFFRCKYIYTMYTTSNKLLDYYFIDNTKEYQKKFKEIKLSITTTFLVIINVIILYFHQDHIFMKYIEGFLCFYLLVTFFRHMQKRSKGNMERIIIILFRLIFEPLLQLLLVLQFFEYLGQISEKLKDFILPFVIEYLKIHNENLVISIEVLINTIFLTSILLVFLLVYIVIFQPSINLNKYINILSMFNSIIILVNLANMTVNIFEFNKIHLEGLSVHVAIISFPIVTSIMIVRNVLDQQKRKREKVAKKLFINVLRKISDKQKKSSFNVDTLVLEMKKCCVFGGDNYILLFYSNPKTESIVKRLEYQKEVRSYIRNK
ncbi:hypothetical protein ABEX45_04280 [Bacillus subtilis]